MSSGRVAGYEYSVTCLACDYCTDLRVRHEPSEGFVCGSDFPGSDAHGCGRTLRTIVEVVEGDADE